MRVALLIVTALFAASPVLAHSWYPLACCGHIDCFPVTCDQLVETVSGWLYVPTGNLFKPSAAEPGPQLPCVPWARPRSSLYLRVHCAERVAGRGWPFTNCGTSDHPLPR